MSVPIEKSNATARTFVTPTSRYINSKTLLYSDNKVITFEIYKRKTRVTSLSNDKFAVIPPGEEYRPDLTSYRAYGTVDFWWQIMQENKIYDIFDYKAGKNILIPLPFNGAFNGPFSGALNG